MKRFFILLSIVAIFTTTQVNAQQKPIPVIFETDMGNDIDDAMALDLLFKKMDQGVIDLIGVSVHKDNPRSKDFIDIMRLWYGYEKVPIGVNSKWITDLDCNDYCTKVVNLKGDDGKPMFARSKNPKYEDAVQMYRRLLSKAEDKSVVVITVGFCTTLAELMMSGPDKYSKLSGEELIAKKVKYFSVMAGDFERPKYAEYNVWNDLVAAKYFFHRAPAPMVITPFTMGPQVKYPATSIENDFTWAEHHPMVEAYKAYDKMPYDRPSWDILAVGYTCDYSSELFSISEVGDVKVVDKGCTHFTANPKGKIQYLWATPEQQKALLNYLIKEISAKPKNKQ